MARWSATVRAFKPVEQCSIGVNEGPLAAHSRNGYSFHTIGMRGSGVYEQKVPVLTVVVR